VHQMHPSHPSPSLSASTRICAPLKSIIAKSPRSELSGLFSYLRAHLAPDLVNIAKDLRAYNCFLGVHILRR
jgi:hypothetical protein